MEYLVYAIMSCSTIQTLDQIKTLQSNIPNQYARRLSAATCKASKKHGIKPETLLSIMHVESNFHLDAVNSKTLDYGIGQINLYNIRALGLSKHRLLTDLEYSVDSAALILSWFHKTYHKREPGSWFCRYNIGTRQKVGALGKICKGYNGKVLKRLEKMY